MVSVHSHADGVNKEEHAGVCGQDRSGHSERSFSAYGFSNMQQVLDQKPLLCFISIVFQLAFILLAF